MYSIEILPVTIHGSDEEYYCAKFISDIPFISMLLKDKWYDGTTNLCSNNIMLLRHEDIKLKKFNDNYVDNIDGYKECDLSSLDVNNTRIIFKGGRISIIINLIVREITRDNIEVLIHALDYIPKVREFKIDNGILSKYNKCSITYKKNSLTFVYNGFMYNISIASRLGIKIPDLYNKLSSKLPVLCDIFDNMTILLGSTELVSHKSEELTIERLFDKIPFRSIYGTKQLLVNGTPVFTFDMDCSSCIDIFLSIMLYIVDMPLQMKSAR